MKLLLFDIDGTLISSGGAATKAVNRAFEKIYGVRNAMEGIRADGKTDPLILREMFNSVFKRDSSEGEADNIYREYIGFLSEELVNAKNFTVMIGIPELLSFFSERSDIKLGIATGNIEQGAWIKLRHSGLDSYFNFGAFGSDSEQREMIIRIAIERGERLYNERKGYEKVIVIGDTPQDIIHGRLAGAEVLAVSTGSYSKVELEYFNPHYLIEDFKDTDSAIKILTD